VASSRAAERPGAWVVTSVPDNLAALAVARAKAFQLIVTSDKSSGGEDIELLRNAAMVPFLRNDFIFAPADPLQIFRLEHYDLGRTFTALMY
jgi:hypothetical protein